MNQEKIELEARLGAIEYYLAEAFRMLYAISGATPEMIVTSHDRLREQLRTMTIPDAPDPARADLAAGVLQDAHERLLKMIANAALESRK